MIIYYRYPHYDDPDQWRPAALACFGGPGQRRLGGFKYDGENVRGDEGEWFPPNWILVPFYKGEEYDL